MSIHSAGMFRMNLTLNPHDPIHQQFAEWIADLEKSSEGPWGLLKRSSTIYNNGIRLMFFSDTNAFDSAGVLSAEFMKAKSLSALVTLVGLWTTDDKYGLKFRVEQFKFSEDAIPYPAEEDAPPPVSQQCMFIQDDGE